MTHRLIRHDVARIRVLAAAAARKLRLAREIRGREGSRRGERSERRHERAQARAAHGQAGPLRCARPWPRRLPSCCAPASRRGRPSLRADECDGRRGRRAVPTHSRWPPCTAQRSRRAKRLPVASRRWSEPIPRLPRPCYLAPSLRQAHTATTPSKRSSVQQACGRASSIGPRCVCVSRVSAARPRTARPGSPSGGVTAIYRSNEGGL